MHNTSGDGGGGGGGGTKLLSAGSFEHLNLLSALNSNNSASANKNFSNGIVCTGSTTPSGSNTADLENINPLLMMNGPSNGGLISCQDLGLSKFGSLFKSGHFSNTAVSSDEDEMLLFSNSMLLETCLLKVSNFKTNNFYKK